MPKSRACLTAFIPDTWTPDLPWFQLLMLLILAYNPSKFFSTSGDNLSPTASPFTQRRVQVRQGTSQCFACSVGVRRAFTPVVVLYDTLHSFPGSSRR